MKNNGKKFAAALLMVAAVVAGGYGVARAVGIAPSAAQKAFDDRWAKRRLEFDKEYNAVKQESNRIKQKFNNCKTLSDDELHAHVARDLTSRGRK